MPTRTVDVEAIMREAGEVAPSTRTGLDEVFAPKAKPPFTPPTRSQLSNDVPSVLSVPDEPDGADSLDLEPFGDLALDEEELERETNRPPPGGKADADSIPPPPSAPILAPARPAPGA